MCHCMIWIKLHLHYVRTYKDDEAIALHDDAIGEDSDSEYGSDDSETTIDLCDDIIPPVGCDVVNLDSILDAVDLQVGNEVVISTVSDPLTVLDMNIHQSQQSLPAFQTYAHYS